MSHWVVLNKFYRIFTKSSNSLYSCLMKDGGLYILIFIVWTNYQNNYNIEWLLIFSLTLRLHE